jgi:hypothetical protein
MKFIFCTCNVSITERITDLLDKNEVCNYQISDHVVAKNATGAPRYDTPVWPGYNVNITMQFSDNEKAEEVVDLLRKFNKESAYNNDELITVCSWDMDNYIVD